MNTKIPLLPLTIQSHYARIFSIEIRILAPSLEFIQPIATSDHIKASPAKRLQVKIPLSRSKIMLTYARIFSTEIKPIGQGRVSS